MLVEQEGIRRMVDEAAKASLAFAQFILCFLARGDVARYAQKPTVRLAQIGESESRPETRFRPCAYGGSRK